MAVVIGVIGVIGIYCFTFSALPPVSFFLTNHNGISPERINAAPKAGSVGAVTIEKTKAISVRNIVKADDLASVVDA